MLNKLSSLLPVIALTALAACATQGKLREADLGRIADWLPGQYSNAAQVDADLRSAADVHPALQINVLPVMAPFIGDLVLYVEQIDTANRQRIVSQQLYLFEKTVDGKGIVQRIFDFKEPQRWASGHLRADIFKSVVKDDLTTSAACDLGWTYAEQQFVGVAGRKGCPIRRMEFDGLDLKIEPAGRPAGDYLRFKRIGAQE